MNNVDTGECVVRWRGHTDSVTKVAYKQSQSKHYVLSGSRDATVKLWMFNNPDPVENFTTHKLTVTAVCNIEGESLYSVLSTVEYCTASLFFANIEFKT